MTGAFSACLASTQEISNSSAPSTAEDFHLDQIQGQAHVEANQKTSDDAKSADPYLAYPWRGQGTPQEMLAYAASTEILTGGSASRG